MNRPEPERETRGAAKGGAESAPFVPGRFGRYELVERIATGGMAEIFRAKVKGAYGFERQLVVKRILPQLSSDAEFVDMFIDEARLMARLHHPKIVQVQDFGEVDGQYFIAMEYMEGIDLLTLLRTCAKRRCRPTVGITVHIIADVLDGLAYAHELTDEEGKPLEIVHRDISPSNILVSREGEVKLTDFGIARVATPRRHQESRALKGKYGYMAPEQVLPGGQVDHRADIFAVGVVLAELLMIRRLFIASSEIDVLMQVRDARLDRLQKYGRRIPADLMQIVEAALARDPALRYQGASAFRDALHRFLFENRLAVRRADVRTFLSQLDAAEVPPARGPRVPRNTRDLPEATRSAEIRLGAALLRPSGEVPRAGGAAEPPAAMPPTDEATPAMAAVAASVPADVARAATLPGEEDGDAPLGAPVVTGVGMRPPPAAAPRTEADGGAGAGARPRRRSVVGKRRRIMLTPPPRTSPVPTEPDVATPRRSGEPLHVARDIPGTGTNATRDFAAASLSSPAAIPRETLAEAAAAPEPRPAARVPPRGQPAAEGDLGAESLFGVLFRRAVAEDTGLLVLSSRDAGVVKDIFLVDGDPHYIRSTRAEELFGHYLVSRSVISQGELSLALAMLPHFSGRLGDALVGLKLMRPMQVLRHLTHQVRQKLLEAFAWTAGRYRYYEGQRSEEEGAPLGLDAFEVMGAAVDALPADVLRARLEPWLVRRPRRLGRPSVPPEVFRLGDDLRLLYDSLDGRLSVADLIAREASAAGRQRTGRLLYLLLETGLARG